MPLRERLHRLQVVPVIGRRDHDDVDVGPGAELAIVVIDGALVDAGGFAGALLALVPDVVDGDRLDVAALLVALHDAADVGVHAAAAADEPDVDAIVGADDAALGHRGRLGERLEGGGGRDRSSRGDGADAHLPDEIASRRRLVGSWRLHRVVAGRRG